MPSSNSLSTGASSVVVHRSSVRHECFYFDSAGDRLYGTLYSPAKGAPRLGVVLSPAWVMEGLTMHGWCHRTARDLAASGMATVIPHWPGTQDSEGDPLLLTFDRLVEAATDAGAAAAQRCDIPAWGAVGIGIGAAVAAMLAATLPATRLVLAQPALDPEEYFATAERRFRRASLGAVPQDNWAFSTPIPSGLRSPLEAPRVAAALEAFAASPGCTGAIVRYRKPEAAAPPAGFDLITVRGNWSRPTKNDHADVRRRVSRWLMQSLKRGG